jgi:hypothetical protein
MISEFLDTSASFFLIGFGIVATLLAWGAGGLTAYGVRSRSGGER